MKKIFIALGLGVAAGLIDIIPMLIMNLSVYATVSAFLHWVVLGLIIPFVNWNLRSWVKGIVIALISILPVMVLVKMKPEDVIPMTISSIILGALIGLFGKKWIHTKV